jgi:DEAD/DEAH box helicase domain-containing protein
MNTVSPSPNPIAAVPPASLPLFHHSVLSDLGWQHETTLTLPERAGGVSPANSIPSLQAATKRLLATTPPLYGHQALALKYHLEGKSVVVSTGTGSGKSRIFHLAATEQLDRSPTSLIIALYPGKALAREQAGKWQEALIQAGLACEKDGSVGLLTGDQNDKAARLRALARAKVAVMTPDVLHAWCLQRLSDAGIRKALARTALVIIDEAHVLSGVFGSNCLWLFRRLRNALHVLGAGEPRWLAASATLKQPTLHLETLVGVPFQAVTEENDTSPRHRTRIHLVRPMPQTGLLPGMGSWLRRCASDPSQPRFVVFTNSRKQAEAISVIGNRLGHERETADSQDATAIILNEGTRLAPFRSGLSQDERAQLQDSFGSGRLRGLVCTSAFELGVDIPGLDLGFLIGLPESPTSFWQRLGRFGRHAECDVFLVHDGSTRCDAVFAHPESLLDWRAKDTAIYPDNPILIARNILCLAHETRDLTASPNQTSAITVFPDLFNQQYIAFGRGEYSLEMRDALSRQAHDIPHLVFPLRSIDETYTFRSAHGGHAPEGSLTYGQLLREAYPGAVYYHGGIPWRITCIDRRRRELVVVRERNYRTEPCTVPVCLQPDLARPVFADLLWANGLRLMECHGRATEFVTGFSETRGSNPVTKGDYSLGCYGQNGPLFRGFDSTAILVFHPALIGPEKSGHGVLLKGETQDEEAEIHDGI